MLVLMYMEYLDLSTTTIRQRLQYREDDLHVDESKDFPEVGLFDTGRCIHDHGTSFVVACSTAVLGPNRNAARTQGLDGQTTHKPQHSNGSEIVGRLSVRCSTKQALTLRPFTRRTHSIGFCIGWGCCVWRIDRRTSHQLTNSPPLGALVAGRTIGVSRVLLLSQILPFPEAGRQIERKREGRQRAAGRGGAGRHPRNGLREGNREEQKRRTRWLAHLHG